VQATRLGYEISDKRLELRKQRDRTDYLRLEMVKLKSPERLAQRARRRLGMTPPSPECLVFLGSSVPRSRGPLAASLRPKTRPVWQLASLLGGAAR